MSSAIKKSKKVKNKGLDTSILSSFKPKGINLPEKEISSAVNEFTSKLKESPDLLKKDLKVKRKKVNKEKKYTDNQSSLSFLVDMMNRGITANEIKLLAAIENEARETGIDIPPMSTTYIVSKYGINKKYLGDSVKGLIEKGYITRHPSKFKGQKSFAWEVVKEKSIH